MNIVPLTASVFVVAFQESSPLGVASSQITVWPAACDAAVVPFAPRVTVHVVVPKPEVTVITSSSILRWNCEVGKPVIDATVTVFWPLFIADDRDVEAPGPTRQMYELEGVRSTVPTLLSRAG